MKELHADTAIFIAYEDLNPEDPAYPERCLMLAIIQGALKDVNGPGHLCREAKAYFMSNDTDYLFSFVSICNFLKICPNTLREHLGLKTGSNCY